MCNTAGMAGREYEKLLPEGTEIDPDVEDLLTQLEAAGWLPRKLVDGSALRYWPDNQRGRQITIDLRYPPNEQKLAFYRIHTGIDF